MIIKSITIISFSFVAGIVYSAFVWIGWDKPEGIIFGSTAAPIILAILLYYFTIPAIIIPIILFVSAYKKKLALHAILASSILGGYWFLMVVFSNTRAFLD